MLDLIQLITNDSTGANSPEFAVSEQTHNALEELKYYYGFLHFQIDFLSDQYNGKESEIKDVINWLNENVYEPIGSEPITPELIKSLTFKTA